MSRGTTRTGGRSATTAVIPGRYALSVGRPDVPEPPGWSWTLLTDIARLETGHTPSRKHPEYWDGDIPWIGIKDAVQNHGFTIDDTHQHTNELGITHSSARLLPASTVCLSRTASVGYVVVMGRPMATSQDFVNWVCSDAIDYRFLKYVLVAEHETFPMFASGATHQTVYFPEVKAFHVMLPPIDTQRRIAAVLSAYDDLIANNTRRIAILEDMARIIYREWFVEYRYPGHQGAELAESQLGPLPEGWEVVTLNSIASSKRYALNGGPFGSKLGRNDYVEEGVPVIRGKNLNGPFGFSGDEFVFVSSSKADELHANTAHPGDIVVTQRGTLGQVGLIPADSEHDRFVVSQSQMKLTVDEELASPMYVYSALRSDRVNRRLVDMAIVAGVPHINLGLFREFEIALPPLNVLKEFDDLVIGPLKLARNLVAANRKLQASRDILLPRLITGEIDPSCPEGDLGVAV